MITFTSKLYVVFLIFVYASNDVQAQFVKMLEKSLKKLELSHTEWKYYKSYFINQWEQVAKRGI